MKKSTKYLVINNVIFFVIWFGVLAIVFYLGHLWSDSLLSIFGLPDHTVYFVIFASPFMLLAYAAYIYVVKKISRDEE